MRYFLFVVALKHTFFICFVTKINIYNYYVQWNWKSGGSELRMHLLELCNTIIDKNQIPQEWETGLVIKIHKKGTKKVKITEELLYCLQPTNYLQK